MIFDFIELILSHYSYISLDVIHSKEYRVYKHSDNQIASYFILNNIDCREFEDSEVKMKEALEVLEFEFTNASFNQNESLRTRIVNAIGDNQEASQIDKNTSAIYLLQFDNLENLKKHSNLIYAIEESANYFKRYILPYTDSQVDQLNQVVQEHKGNMINDILSTIADNEDEYYKHLNGRNVGSEYEFVIRLFSKIPFLQYHFKSDRLPQSIEDDIAQKVSDELLDYHEIIQNHNCSVEEFLRLEPDITLNEDQLNKELNSWLGGGM